ADDAEVMALRQQKHVEEMACAGEATIWIETYKTPVIDTQGNVLGTAGFYRDITERKTAEEQIKQLAFYDPLTGLPNRRLLMDRLQQALVGGARTRQGGALLFVDLDNFKLLNDTCGHDTGDLLLREVALRLTASVRQSDTVARLGGDEFVILLENLSNNTERATSEARS